MPMIEVPNAGSMIQAFRQGRLDRMADDEMRLKMEEAKEAREKKKRWEGAMGRAFLPSEPKPMSGAMIAPTQEADMATVPTTMAPRWNEQTQSYEEQVPAPVASPNIAIQSAQSRTRLNPDVFKEMLIIDPEQALKLHDAFAKMDEADMKRYEAKNKVLGSIAADLLSVPPGQRAQAIRIVAPALLNAGWTPEELNQADLSDRGLQSYRALAVDAEKIMTEARQEREFQADERHRRVTEGQGERRLGVAESNLSLAREREARIRKWGPQPMFGVLGQIPTTTDDLDY